MPEPSSSLRNTAKSGTFRYKTMMDRHVHSWLTLQLPSLFTVTTGRQGVPQLLVPGSFGLPFGSSARFHIRPLCELCWIEPIKLCSTSNG